MILIFRGIFFTLGLVLKQKQKNLLSALLEVLEKPCLNIASFALMLIIEGALEILMRRNL